MNCKKKQPTKPPLGLAIKLRHQAMPASPILMPSPVQCSPLVVGKCSKSGLYCASRELLVKSAPKPPQTKLTQAFPVHTFHASSGRHEMKCH